MYMTHERAHPSWNENIFIIFPVFLSRAPPSFHSPAYSFVLCCVFNFPNPASLF